MAALLTDKQRRLLDAERDKARAAIPTTRCPLCDVHTAVRDLARHLVARCPGQLEHGF